MDIAGWSPVFAALLVVMGITKALSFFRDIAR